MPFLLLLELAVESDPVVTAGCRWLTTYEHAFQTGSIRRAEKQSVTCCHCKTKLEYINSYVTVPYGLHGNRLPLPVFIHCPICATTLDPQVAYMAAWKRDAAAALPDPEKVQREKDLNEQLSKMPEE